MGLNKKSTFYTALVATTAILIYVYLYFNHPFPDWSMILGWAALAIVVEAMPIVLPERKAAVSVGYTFMVAAVVVGGPLLAPTAFGLQSLLQIRRIDQKTYHIFNSPFYQTVFNISQVIIYTSLMGLLYLFFGGKTGTVVIIPGFLIVTIGLALNLMLIIALLSLRHQRNPYEIWKINFADTFATSFVQGVLGLALASIYLLNPLIAIILFLALIYGLRFLFRQHVRNIENYLSTMEIVNRLLEAKDPYTSGHANRVNLLATRLAQTLRFNVKTTERISRAAALHDIGKIGISDVILNKPAKLTPEEYEEVKKHPELGAKILAGAGFLQDCVEIILHHHERYDGQGYPAGLKGGEIPEEASIIAIADAYDAMTTERPYRAALTKKEALAEVENNAGSQFHPHFAREFVEFMENHEEYPSKGEIS